MTSLSARGVDLPGENETPEEHLIPIPLPEGSGLRASIHLTGAPVSSQALREIKSSVLAILDELAALQSEVKPREEAG